MNSGEFYWNTGLFIARCSTMRNSLKALFPPVLSVIDSASVYSLEAEQAHIAKRYSAYPNLSVDSAVLEKGTNVYVKNASFGWADLGTWHSMYETMSKCMGDNVVIGNKVKLDNCHGNIVKRCSTVSTVISWQRRATCSLSARKKTRQPSCANTSTR